MGLNFDPRGSLNRNNMRSGFMRQGAGVPNYNSMSMGGSIMEQKMQEAFMSGSPTRISEMMRLANKVVEKMTQRKAERAKTDSMNKIATPLLNNPNLEAEQGADGRSIIYKDKTTGNTVGEVLLNEQGLPVNIRYYNEGMLVAEHTDYDGDGLTDTPTSKASTTMSTPQSFSSYLKNGKTYTTDTTDTTDSKTSKNNRWY